MSLKSRIASWLPWRRSAETDADDGDAPDSLWSVISASGVRIDQRTALACSAVMAAVTILAEDVAKCTPQIYRRLAGGGREVAKDHFLYRLLTQPNDYMDGFEFLELGQAGLVFRGNAYAVIRRDWRARPTELIPVNPDWVTLWEAPTGDLFYRVAANGLHMRAKLAGLPDLIPAEDVLHVRGFTLNGLLGGSRISLARDAIGLAIGQEQQAARWVGNGAKPAGILKTKQRLSKAAAERMKEDWKAAYGSYANAGKTPVFEEGLEWQALSLSSQELEFLASRRFQVEEVARIFRVPPHMIGDLADATNNNIESQGQDYVNYTIAGYTDRWARKLEWHFDLPNQDLFIEFDTARLTRADIKARYDAYRTGIMSGFLSRNEARTDDGKNPRADAEALLVPTNMASDGSQSTGTAPDGAGRPEDGTVP
jgi:HK97 family phage portal protein